MVTWDEYERLWAEWEAIQAWRWIKKRRAYDLAFWAFHELPSGGRNA